MRARRPHPHLLLVLTLLVAPYGVAAETPDATGDGRAAELARQLEALEAELARIAAQLPTEPVAVALCDGAPTLASGTEPPCPPTADASVPSAAR